MAWNNLIHYILYRNNQEGRGYTIWSEIAWKINDLTGAGSIPAVSQLRRKQITMRLEYVILRKILECMLGASPYFHLFQARFEARESAGLVRFQRWRNPLTLSLNSKSG